MFLDRIWGRLIAGLRNAGLFARYAGRRRHVSSDGPRVFFDISEPRLERYLYWLLKMFDLAGWNVSLRARPNLLLNLRNCSDYIYDIESLDIRFSTPPVSDLSISDRAAVGAIRLDTDYFQSDKPENSVSVPFSMHPDVYHLGLNETLQKFALTERPIRVFLGGNFGRVYDTPEMTRQFGLMNRYEIASAILGELDGPVTLSAIKSKRDAESLLNRSERGAIAMMTDFRLELEGWMRMLGASDFFVAPPGVIMPFSHNIIEAMAVGTIPITQYGHLFDPPLEDGKTSIRFESPGELCERLRELSKMAENQVRTLRANVAHYYESHLAPAAVVRKVAGGRIPPIKLFLVAGHMSINKMEKARERSV